ncbi:class I SAM-dependent methyltransferase [Patescibacteria group bacterium]|nr:class I SAM-dependent methyltransferase [Patescibacteria group bacterium]
MFWVAVILLIMILPFALAGWLFAPWIPIKNSELERLGKVLKLKPTDTFYELGCGDGRVVRFVAKKFGCKSVGIELNPFLYATSRLLQASRRERYVLGDLFAQDLSPASCVYLYGLPRTINKRVQAKLETELPVGATVISYGFLFQKWQPVKIDKATGKLPIFVYQR